MADFLYDCGVIISLVFAYQYIHVSTLKSIFVQGKYSKYTSIYMYILSSFGCESNNDKQPCRAKS